MNTYILKADQIQKKYNGNIILHDISIHLKEGELYGLIGKNGSGKTTLLRILTGQIQKYVGTVSFGESNDRSPKISAVIDSPSIYLNLSAFENMKEHSLLLGIPDETKINQVLKMVGLGICPNKRTKDFSLGMIQRLKIGMALLEKPDILILDEPLNGLDPDGIVELRKLLLQLNQKNNVTILISSHILGELEQTVTRLGILHNGKIVKEISKADVLHSGKTLETLYMQYTKGGYYNDKYIKK